jgi:hypothetical protein
MKKLKASIIEKIEKKQPKKGNFNLIKKKLTYTWVAPKYQILKPWHKLSFGLVAVCIIMFCIGTYFNNNFYVEPVVTDKVKEMKLVSWDDDVYLLGETIYVDYPMLTTKCNIDSKITFSDSYWEVYSDDVRIDKENIPLTFGVNSFTIYEKSFGEDKRLYNLNILVGRDIENFDINLINSFKKIDSKTLQEQVKSFNTFKQFEQIVVENNLDINLLHEFNEEFFESNSLLMIISKNNLNELTYQPVDDELNVTLIGDNTNVYNGYLIPILEINNIRTYNVELFDFNVE